MGSSVRARLQRHLIRRKRKLTILLRPGPPVKEGVDKDEGLGAEYDLENAYNTNRFLSVCKNSWGEWMAAVTAERARALELVTQYPLPSNLGALFELESLSMKMTKVTYICI